MNQQVTEHELPMNQRSRLAAALMATLQFGSSVSDFIISEGQPVQVKSALGVVPLSKLNVPHSDFAVLPAEIKNFVASYVFNSSATESASAYWDRVIEPLLAEKKAIHRSLVLQADRPMHLRLSIYRHMRSKLGVVVRLIMPPPPLAQLALAPQILDRLRVKRPNGLLIITGPTASGKTTTALSILESMNTTSSGHITTIEDPIEYELTGKGCAITQREVGTDVASFGQGLIEAMRHAPDAILCSEVREMDAALASINGGESGALMVVTTHGRSILGTLRKLLAYCGENSDAMRTVLAGSLIGVIRQERVPFKDGTGFGLVHETLHATDAVTQALAKGDWPALQKMMRSEAATDNFSPLHPRLTALINERKVEVDVANQVMRAAVAG